MRAVLTTAAGDPPRVEDIPAPAPGPGQSLVRLRAAGLNPVDLAIAAGRFYMPVPEPPRVAGAEAVGEVVQSAAHAPGTVVWCLQPTGCFAERFVVDDDAMVALPDGTDPVMAAALGIAGLAGWMPVRTRGALAPGETLVVLGASGIVGQVAVQAGVLGQAGAVVAVGRSERGLATARDLGATDSVTLTEDGDLTAALRRACPGGIDVLVDTLWGPPLAAAIPVLGTGGRVVQVGSAAGPAATIVAGPMRGGRNDIRGFSVFSEDRADVAAEYRALLAAAAAGSVRVDTRTVALEDAAEAFAAQGAGTDGVKLVLVPAA
ncbi:MAG: zinc-binding alcohol dehydrogenase family protein [Thermoleophilia bacterium]